MSAKQSMDTAVVSEEIGKLSVSLPFEIAFLVFAAFGTTLSRISQDVGWPSTICEASAWCTAILTLLYAGDMRQRFELMLMRLFRRGVISTTSKVQATVLGDVRNAADRGAMIGGFLLPVLLLTSYVSLSIEVLPFDSVCETIGAFILGRYLGRGIVYGYLGMFLQRHRAEINIKLAHPDGAAGLKPAGEYYTFQATLLMFPTAFLAIWWLAMKIWIPTTSLAGWQNWYLAFFVLAILFEIFAFILPLLYFHQEMKAKKREMLQQADEIGERIVKTRNQLLVESASSRIRVLEDELEGLTEQFQNIEALASWPFDAALRRRLTISNVSLVIPIVVGNLGQLKESVSNLLAV